MKVTIAKDMLVPAVTKNDLFKPQRSRQRADSPTGERKELNNIPHLRDQISMNKLYDSLLKSFR
jgi:hypothetical protein